MSCKNQRNDLYIHCSPINRLEVERYVATSLEDLRCPAVNLRKKITNQLPTKANKSFSLNKRKRNQCRMLQILGTVAKMEVFPEIANDSDAKLPSLPTRTCRILSTGGIESLPSVVPYVKDA